MFYKFLAFVELYDWLRQLCLMNMFHEYVARVAKLLAAYHFYFCFRHGYI